MALWAFWCVWQGVTLSAWCRLCGVSVSGLVLWLSVWLSGGLLWLCVSGGLCGSSGVLCLWCCRAVWCRSLLWWSGVLSSGLLVVSSLVWSSGVWSCVWSGVWYIISSALNFYAHEKSATLHDTLPLAYHTINFPRITPSLTSSHQVLSFPTFSVWCSHLSLVF